MTYNFDPERWLERQQAWLRHRREAGELTDSELEAALGELETRYQALLARLDGSYQLPR
jgi:hypothetical protein